MKKTGRPKAFNIYFDTFEHIEMLTMQQRGELFTALYEYAISERNTEFDNGMVKMAFSFMKAQIARDFEKYREKCEKNRACILKRYEKKEEATNEYERNIDEEDSTNVYERNLDDENSTNVYERYQEEKEEEEEKEEYKEEEKKKEKEKKEEKEKEFKKEKEKENKKEEDLKSSLSDSLSSRIDYDSVLDSFNRICGNIFAVDTMTDSRKAAVDNAAGILGDTSFEQLFERVERSDFLSGRNGKWYGCNFDWILKPEILRKILSGAYDNPANKNPSYEEYKPYRSTSYDIKELMKIDTLDFMDEPGWEKKAFGNNGGAKTGWDVPF